MSIPTAGRLRNSASCRFRRCFSFKEARFRTRLSARLPKKMLQEKVDKFSGMSDSIQEPVPSEIDEIAQGNARAIAVVGMSSNPERPSYPGIEVPYSDGDTRSFRSIQWRPEILGLKSYASLSDIRDVLILSMFFAVRIKPTRSSTKRLRSAPKQFGSRRR